MKAVPAQTLRAYLNSGSINISDAVLIVRYLAETVDAAHRSGVKHCGVSPSNVILTQNGQGHLHPRLINASTAYAEDETLTGDSNTLPAGSFRESVLYMSPEECQGSPPDARSDIYTLGVILYQLLVGRPPFDAETPVAIARQHVEEMPSLTDLRLPALQPITPLIMHALNKNPEARPSTQEFVRNLRYLEFLVPSSPRAASNGGSAAQGNDSPTGSPIFSEHPSPDAIVSAPVYEEVPTEVPTVVPALPALPNIAATISNPLSAPPVEVADHSLGETTDEIEEITEEVEEPTEEVEEIRAEVRRDADVPARTVEPVPVQPLQAETDIKHQRFALVVKAPEGEEVKRQEARIEPLQRFSPPNASTDNARHGNRVEPLQRFSPPSISPTPIVVPVPETRAINRRSSRMPAYLLLGAAVLALSVGAYWLYSKRNSTESATSEETTNQSLANNGSTSEQESLGTETFSPEMSDPSTQSNPAPSRRETSGARIVNPAEARTALRGNLDSWVTSTNARDIDRQMSLYMPRLTAYYRARNVSRSSVRADKIRLLRRASSFNIQASDPEIVFSPDGRTATMRFRKRYLTRRGQNERRGEVVQELRWVMTNDGWRINSERDVRVIS